MFEVTGRRNAKRGGNPQAQIAGGSVDRLQKNFPHPPGGLATRHRSAKIELPKLNLNGEYESLNGYYVGWCGSGKELLRGLRGGLRRADRGAAGVQPRGAF